MVKLLKQSTLSLHFEKHKGSTGGLQRHNEREPGQRHSNKNIVPERTKDNIFLVPKDDRTYMERINDRLEVGYKGEKAIRKDAVKMIEVTVQFGGDITETSEETQVEALKEAYEELKKMYGEDNIISAVIHLDETTPHLHMDFVPLTKRGNLSAKDIIGDKKKMRKTQANFLDKMKERCPFAKFERLEPEKAQFNGLDQKLYEKMTASIKAREDKLCDREDYIEDKEIELEEKEEYLNKVKESFEEKEIELKKRERQIEKDEDGLVFDRDELEADRKAFERERKSILAVSREIKAFSLTVEEEAAKNEDKEKALNEREALLNERETELNAKEDFIRVADQKASEALENARVEKEKAEQEKREAQKLMREANERIEVAEATESRVKKLLETLESKGKELMRNIKETIGRWTSKVSRDRRNEVHEYFQERTEKLADDLEEDRKQDDFVRLAYEDLHEYDNDMNDAFEL